jgi:TonB family protein
MKTILLNWAEELEDRMRQVINALAILAMATMSIRAQGADSPIWKIHQAPDSDGIYYTGPEVTAPVLLRTVQVPYPPDDYSKDVQGMTVLAVVIGANGAPDHIHILYSNGDFCDEASIEAVENSTFAPAKLGDKPVPVRIDVRVVFHANRSLAVPQVLISERDLPVPDESKFEDKHGNPLPYTEPIPIHTVDADFADPFAVHPYIQVAIVAVLVGVDGLPKEVRVARGLGFGLDKKAADAVWHYRFLPATKRGEPIVACRNVMVSFVEF